MCTFHERSFKRTNLSRDFSLKVSKVHFRMSILHYQTRSHLRMSYSHFSNDYLHTLWQSSWSWDPPHPLPSHIYSNQVPYLEIFLKYNFYSTIIQNPTPVKSARFACCGYSFKTLPSPCPNISATLLLNNPKKFDNVLYSHNVKLMKMFIVK